MIVELIEKESRELVRRPLAIAALFLVSLLAFLLSDQFLSVPAPLRTAIVDESCTTSLYLRALVAEQPELRLVRPAELAEGSLWRQMDGQRLHLLIVCRQSEPVDEWQAFASLHDARDVARAHQAVELLNRSLAARCPWYLQAFGSQPQRNDPPPPPPPLPPSDFYPVAPDAAAAAPHSALPAEAPPPGPANDPAAYFAKVDDNKNAGSVLECVGRADSDKESARIEIRLRGGSVRAGSTWLMPGMAMMLSLLMTFYVASAVHVRERSLGAWPAFRLGSAVTPLRVLVAKLAVPLFLGLASLCIYLLLGELYGVRVKAELVMLALLFYLPALCAVALQGLIISTVVKSEYAAHMSSAGYLVGMLVFCGLLVPQDWSGDAIRVLGFLFPLSHALPAVESVALHGTDSIVFLPEAITLAAILAASLSACIGLLTWRLQRY